MDKYYGKYLYALGIILGNPALVVLHVRYGYL